MVVEKLGTFGGTAPITEDDLNHHYRCSDITIQTTITLPKREVNPLTVRKTRRGTITNKEIIRGTIVKGHRDNKPKITIITILKDKRIYHRQPTTTRIRSRHHNFKMYKCKVSNNLSNSLSSNHSNHMFNHNPFNQHKIKC